MCTPAVLLAAVLLTGCDEALNSPALPGLVARTEHRTYAKGETITVTISNRGDTPVFFKHCGRLMMREVEVQSGVCWEPSYFTVCKNHLMPEYRPLFPGDTVSFVDLFVSREDGVYRWVIPFGTEPIPELPEKLFSNAFRVQ